MEKHPSKVGAADESPVGVGCNNFLLFSLSRPRLKYSCSQQGSCTTLRSASSVAVKCVCEVRYKRTTFISAYKKCKKCYLQLSRLSRFFTSRVGRNAYIVIISTGCAGCYTKGQWGPQGPPAAACWKAR